MRGIKIDYYRLRAGKWGGVDVVGFGTYPRHSVLAGQTAKVFLDNFRTEAEAMKAYPKAEGYTSKWTEPQVSLAHLPDENTPVAGGMYPDDI